MNQRMGRGMPRPYPFRLIVKKELCTQAGLFLFALIVIHESLQIPVWEEGYPMGGFFPLCLGILLGLNSLLYFWVAKGKKGRGESAPWAGEPESPVRTSAMDWRKVLLSMAGIAFYPLLFILGGYLIGTAVFLLFVGNFVERLKITTTVAITIVTLLVSYGLFGYLLGVPLP